MRRQFSTSRSEANSESEISGPEGTVRLGLGGAAGRFGLLVRGSLASIVAEPGVGDERVR